MQINYFILCNIFMILNCKSNSINDIHESIKYDHLCLIKALFKIYKFMHKFSNVQRTAIDACDFNMAR